MGKNAKISILKLFAIFSVICAHCNAVFSENTLILRSSLLLQNIGNVGVLCFFVISGYLFHAEKYDARSVFNKIINLIIPWIISGTVVYFYVYLRKSGVSLISYLQFLIGHGSYLYYVSVLILFYLSFYFIKIFRSNAFLIAFEVLTLISVLFFNKLFDFITTPYLNFINWIGYFALGYQIRINPAPFKKIDDFLFKLKSFVIFAGVILLALNVFLARPGSYWGVPDAIICWVYSIAFYESAVIADMITSGKIKEFMVVSGDNSLFVYLWHMPFAGIVAYLFNLGILQYFALIRPFIVFGVVATILFVMRRFLPGKVCAYFGLKNSIGG
ncbi:MAG: acyltransferase family protein [Clostridia bacterium]|nr:acyltransferase family protein [Clostridia bacterium]